MVQGFGVMAGANHAFTLHYRNLAGTEMLLTVRGYAQKLAASAGAASITLGNDATLGVP
jgi:hypothetical protein